MSISTVHLILSCTCYFLTLECWCLIKISMSPWALVSHFSTDWNFFSKSFYFSRMRKHPDIKQHWCSMSMTLRRNSDLKRVNAFGIFQNREHFRLHLLPELSNSCYTFSINWCEYCKYFLEHLSILSSNLWAYLNIYLDILQVNLPQKKQFWPKNECSENSFQSMWVF